MKMSVNLTAIELQAADVTEILTKFNKEFGTPSFVKGDMLKLYHIRKHNFPSSSKSTVTCMTFS